MPVASMSTLWQTYISQNGSTIDLELPNLSRATIAGIAVAVSGNVLISLALNCQKLAHRRLEAEREAERELVARSTSDQPIAHSDISGDSYFAATRHAVDHDTPRTSSETEPLLRPSAPGLRAPNGEAKVKRSFFSRLWTTRAAREADHAHVGATHVLMPVDVVTIGGTASPNGNGHSPHTKPDSDHDSHDGNESDYLKSKLW